MRPPIVLKRVLPFVGAVTLGLAGKMLFIDPTTPKISEPDDQVVSIQQQELKNGTGSASDSSGDFTSMPGDGVSVRSGSLASTRQLSILSKPRPTYTDTARINNVEGVVRLRVQFLAQGTIGAIQPVQSLPDGLTEQAVAAARQIRFEPKQVNGEPVTVAKIVEYSFTIY